MGLYPHQIQALDATKGRDRVAYYLDMGLGKTYVGAEKMAEIGNDINLLICQKSKIGDWLDHLNAYHDDDFSVFDLTQQGQFWQFQDLAEKGVPIVGVINYELAWRRPWLLNLHGFTLMLDESSLIQNSKAKQTKFVLKLDPCSVILLSGTPTAGKYENLWTQAHLLGWEITKSGYEQTYINFKKFYIGTHAHYRVDPANPYKNVERLKKKFREHGAVFMKTDDVLDMPEQNFIEVKVPSSREYRHFAKNAIVEVKGETLVGDTELTKRLRMRQLCGMYSAEKIQALKDLIASTDDRLVVFYNFNGELEILREVCEKFERPISVVNGEQKDLTAYSDYANSVVLVQYQAGAMGINLQLANKVIYFTPPERSELFEQSKKRIHRIGQERPCFYYLMQCRGTIEPEIYRTLAKREDYTNELFRERFGALQ